MVTDVCLVCITILMIGVLVNVCKGLTHISQQLEDMHSNLNIAISYLNSIDSTLVYWDERGEGTDD